MRPIWDWFADLKRMSKNTTTTTTNNNQKMKHTAIFNAVHRLFIQKPAQKTLLVGSLVCTGLSLQGFGDATQLDQVKDRHVLRVVSVAGDTTFFSQDGFVHGFGYDMSRQFAHDLNVQLDFKQVPSVAAALSAVKQGQADIALTTANDEQIHTHRLITTDPACGEQDALASEGLSTQLTWAFRDGADPLLSTAKSFACEQHVMGTTAQMAAFYSQRVMDDSIEQSALNNALQTRLPILKTSFQMSAKAQQLDWELLAAVGYQESHLNAHAISPTGVAGLMMLTHSTAAAMGVSNREDPVQSIRGGAQYLKTMQDQYLDVPNPDRVWFMLAAYNMGAGNVDRVRRILTSTGQNPNSWANVYRYLAQNAHTNSQYHQCMQYVTHIRSYLEAIKQDSALTRV